MKTEVRTELDFDRKREELIRFLDSFENRHMALATSADGVVQVRMVLVANDGLDIYFFTWKHSRKCSQIERNARVALCKDTVEVEGAAQILGELSDKRIKKFTDIIRRKYPDAISNWEHKPHMILLKVTPTFAVTGAKSENGDTFIDYLDLVNKKAYSERWARF